MIEIALYMIGLILFLVGAIKMIDLYSKGCNPNINPKDPYSVPTTPRVARWLSLANTNSQNIGQNFSQFDSVMTLPAFTISSEKKQKEVPPPLPNVVKSAIYELDDTISMDQLIVDDHPKP